MINSVKAMSIMSFNPSYAVESIQNLLHLCDEIWHKAGDKSTDVILFCAFFVVWIKTVSFSINSNSLIGILND